MRALLLLALLLAAAGARAEGRCDPCTVAGGTYRALAPAGWDGKRPLGLLVFLHGWMQEGGDIVGDRGIAAAARMQGFLLVAPDGLLRTWAHQGAPSRARDEIAFLRAVVADAKARWPIETRRVVAAGFSQGGSMVWDLACRAPEGFTAFLPFSGGFWEPIPERCAGAVDLRHVHGLDDRTVPMAGRAVVGSFRQADIRAGFARWVSADGCGGRPVVLREGRDLTCESWSGCNGGHRLQLCTRPGGHRMWEADIIAGLRWAAGR